MTSLARHTNAPNAQDRTSTTAVRYRDGSNAMIQPASPKWDVVTTDGAQSETDMLKACRDIERVEIVRRIVRMGQKCVKNAELT